MSELEGDHGNLGMYGLRPQQMASVLLETLNAPDRIGEFHSARSPRAPVTSDSYNSPSRCLIGKCYQSKLL